MGNLLELTALAEPNHFWFHGLRAYVIPVINEIAGHRRDLRDQDDAPPDARGCRLHQS